MGTDRQYFWGRIDLGTDQQGTNQLGTDRLGAESTGYLVKSGRVWRPKIVLFMLIIIKYYV